MIHALISLNLLHFSKPVSGIISANAMKVIISRKKFFFFLVCHSDMLLFFVYQFYLPKIDGDGFLTMDEMVRGLERLGNPLPTYAIKLFFDEVNRRGHHVDFEEFVSGFFVSLALNESKPKN